MPIALALTEEQEAKLAELVWRRDRRAVQAILEQAATPTAAVLVEAAVDLRSPRERFGHFLKVVRAEFSFLRTAAKPPGLPVTHDEIYLDHD